MAHWVKSSRKRLLTLFARLIAVLRTRSYGFVSFISLNPTKRAHFDENNTILFLPERSMSVNAAPHR